MAVRFVLIGGDFMSGCCYDVCGVLYLLPGADLLGDLRGKPLPGSLTDDSSCAPSGSVKDTYRSAIVKVSRRLVLCQHPGCEHHCCPQGAMFDEQVLHLCMQPEGHGS